MKNKIIMLALSAMMLLTVSACNSDTGAFLSGQDNVSDTEKEKPEDQSEKEETEQEGEKNDKSEQDKEVKKAVKVYFSDNQAANLIELDFDISISKDESLEEKVIEALKSQPSDPELFNAVGENIIVNSVKVENRQAKVDLSSNGLNGSSTQEMFLIDAVVSSLTALDSVDSVKFLVDGKEVETIMGHAETLEAFTRDDVTTNIISIDKVEK